MSAVEEVDEEADGQPDEEGHPCEDFESHHEHDAEDDAEHRKNRAERGTEGAVTFGLAVAKDEDRDGDQHEREEGADVGEVETVPMSSRPAGMPTTNPATQVATAGVR